MQAGRKRKSSGKSQPFIREQKEGQVKEETSGTLNDYFEEEHDDEDEYDFRRKAKEGQVK
jgi:hypothetical protein